MGDHLLFDNDVALCSFKSVFGKDFDQMSYIYTTQNLLRVTVSTSCQHFPVDVFSHF